MNHSCARLAGRGKEVVRHVVRRAGVQPHGAMLGENAIELVAHHERARRIFQLLEAVAEALEPRAVGEGPLAELRREGVGRRVDPRKQRLLGGEVLRADRAAALEQHVLEEVGGPRNPGPLVHAARTEMRHERRRGRAGAAQQQERHPVGQDVLHDRQTLAGRRFLGSGGCRRHGGGGQQQQQAMHRRSASMADDGNIRPASRPGLGQRWHRGQNVVARRSIACVVASFFPHRTHAWPPRPYTRSSN